MHVVTTRCTYKGRVYETHLLRRSYREGDRVKNETLGNLSHLPAPVIDLVSFDRHSLFTDLTNLSAYAFKFGDRGGSRITSIPSRAINVRNAVEYLVSRCSLSNPSLHPAFAAAASIMM